MRHAAELARQRLRPAGPDAREEGSLIVAVAVISILVILSSFLFVRVVGNTEIVMARQGGIKSVGSADAGLADALFRLDQPAVADGTETEFCLNPADPVPCTVTAGASNPQLDGVTYLAQTVPAGTAADKAETWLVQATGTINGQHGAVQELLSRSVLFPFALFGKKSLTFNGDTTGDFGTYNSSTGTFTRCPSTPTDPACVAVGSDGTISCSGPSPLSLSGVYYNTGSGGGSDSCGTAQSENTLFNAPDPTAPSPNLGCPNGGQPLGDASPDPYPTISGGTYLCTAPVAVDGNLQVAADTGPVLLYIILPSGTNTPTTTFLDVTTDSQINTTISYADMQSGGPQPGDQLPDSQLFQVYSNSVGNLDVNGNHGFVMGGIIDAPEATLTANGCQSYIFGAAVINTYTCNGGPNLGFFYDATLSQKFGPWQVSGYQQINPSQIQWP